MHDVPAAATVNLVAIISALSAKRAPWNDVLPFQQLWRPIKSTIMADSTDAFSWGDLESLLQTITINA